MYRRACRIFLSGEHGDTCLATLRYCAVREVTALFMIPVYRPSLIQRHDTRVVIATGTCKRNVRDVAAAAVGNYRLRGGYLY